MGVGSAEGGRRGSRCSCMCASLTGTATMRLMCVCVNMQEETEGRCHCSVLCGYTEEPLTEWEHSSDSPQT